MHQLVSKLDNLNTNYRLSKIVIQTANGGKHLLILHEVTEHNYSTTLELPDHAPEVLHCSFQWSLCGYVCLGCLVALREGGGYGVGDSRLTVWCRYGVGMV